MARKSGLMATLRIYDANVMTRKEREYVAMAVRSWLDNFTNGNYDYGYRTRYTRKLYESKHEINEEEEYVSKSESV